MPNKRPSIAQRAAFLAENGYAPDALPSYIREERRRRRDLRFARMSAAVLAVALLVFVCLYFFAKNEFQTRCREVFHTSLDNAVTLINQCRESEFDYDRRYREICAELNSAREMLFLSNEAEDRQICFNELYSSFLRMPNQAKLYFADISSGLANIREDKTESGYSTLQNVLSRMDKQDILANQAGEPA